MSQPVLVSVLCSNLAFTVWVLPGVLFTPLFSSTGLAVEAKTIRSCAVVVEWAGGAAGAGLHIGLTVYPFRIACFAWIPLWLGSFKETDSVNKIISYVFQWR